MNQHHLQYKDKINLGAFYTPPEYVEIAWNLIKPFLSKESIVLDSSCGYGNFFMSDIDCRKKANDFDKIAADKTKINFPNIEVFNKNALLNINREEFKIDKNDKLIIIGNPPYNDTTSIIRSDIKKDNIKIDDDVRTRDYGISFLLSYAKLKADVVCVLHPLSYLIKKSNFNLLRKF
jgi:type I restriction-modification system DNA methylase subunit